MVKYIDMTPTWSEILPTWRFMVEQVTTRDKPDRASGKDPNTVMQNFWSEMQRMAEAADRYGEYCKSIDELAGVIEMEQVNEGLHP